MTGWRAALLSAVLAGLALLGAGSARAGRQAPAAPTSTTGELASVSEPAELVVIVNPSRLAHRAAFRHLTAIVDSLTEPNVVLVGLYEQATADDGSTWNRPFLVTQGPSSPPPPPFQPVTASCSGTAFQHALCVNAATRALQTNKAARAQWQAERAAALASWKARIVKRLEMLRSSGPTEESKTGKWDLAAALLRAGQTLASLAPGHRVVLLLGGLAVQRPPSYLSTKLLEGVEIISAGWGGTNAEQRSWIAKLAGAGASISFVPSQVTNLLLPGRVSEALAAPGTPAG